MLGFVVRKLNDINNKTPSPLWNFSDSSEGVRLFLLNISLKNLPNHLTKSEIGYIIDVVRNLSYGGALWTLSERNSI